MKGVSCVCKSVDIFGKFFKTNHDLVGNLKLLFFKISSRVES